MKLTTMMPVRGKFRKTGTEQSRTLQGSSFRMEKLYRNNILKQFSVEIFATLIRNNHTFQPNYLPMSEGVESWNKGGKISAVISPSQIDNLLHLYRRFPKRSISHLPSKIKLQTS